MLIYLKFVNTEQHTTSYSTIFLYILFIYLLTIAVVSAVTLNPCLGPLIFRFKIV